MTQQLRIGSRDSQLAVIQAQLAMAGIRRLNPQADLRLITMKTTGDLILDKTLDQVGGKGLFVKELDQALLDGRVDLTVHSLKDLPAEEDPRLPVVALLPREDPRDCLVLPVTSPDRTHNSVEAPASDSASRPGPAPGPTSPAQNLAQNLTWRPDPALPPIGCSSRRRQIQLQALYPDCQVAMVRGNVPTRLRKLDEGQYSALILAAAGLKRLGLAHRISHYFAPEDMLPAACQGVIAIQARADFDCSCLAGLGDEDVRLTAMAERSFIRTLEGGCSSPVAAYAVISDHRLWLRGLYWEENSGVWRIAEAEGDKEKAAALGQSLALAMRDKGAGRQWSGKEQKS